MRIDDLIGFSILGVFLSFSGIEILGFVRAKLFYVKVKARIISRGEQRGYRNRVYRPTFKYDYNGKTIQSRLKVPALSYKCAYESEMYIYVNPHKPEQINLITLHDTVVYIIVFAACLIFGYIAAINPLG